MPAFGRSIMQLIDPEVPDYLNSLALYASLVAAAVVALNLGMVRLARWAGISRPKPRERRGLRGREGRG